MRFFQITAALAVAATASANLVVKRDAQTVLKDISDITASAKQINTTVSNFQGDVVTALAINSQSSDLSNKLQQATKDTQSSSNFSNTDSASIVNAITALEPVVFDTLDSLVRKKPQFSMVLPGGGANSLVVNDLKSLKNNTDLFSTAVTAKLPQVLAKLAPFLVSDLDYHYQQAINAFS